ncbi:metalloregulator ArsR/SmtB family transcription factor [Ferrimicrobium sp.]|uniref:ArsR/SmtB family transcription factor n=1 Tax=Ferrimicrobium sp. TaxID=2926050 RepID=UPI00261A1D32|nr:metalloregulator ArsR/SmtB family transcription factor [Ferrimicrobium sp.]
MPKSLPVIEHSEVLCCAPVAAGIVSDPDALDLALRLKALADPVRIKILSFVLARGTNGVRNVDLARDLHLTDATISHHLRQLSQAGLLIASRSGASTFYGANRTALGALVRVLDPNCCA